MVFISLSVGKRNCCTYTYITWGIGHSDCLVSLPRQLYIDRIHTLVLLSGFLTILFTVITEDDGHTKLINEASFLIPFQLFSRCRNPEVQFQWNNRKKLLCTLHESKQCVFIFNCCVFSTHPVQIRTDVICSIPSCIYINASRVYWPETPPVNSQW